MSQIRQLLKSPRLLTVMFKCFLKHVPGFRTGEKVNMIIASIYYICCLLFLIIGLVFWTVEIKAVVLVYQGVHYYSHL